MRKNRQYTDLVRLSILENYLLRCPEFGLQFYV